MAFVPLRVSNRQGIPMLEVQSITAAVAPATVTTFNFNDHPQRRTQFFGEFSVKVPQNTTTLTQSDTVEFATMGNPGSNIPVVTFAGTPATVADFATQGGGIRKCWYDITNNRLQLMN